MASGEPAERAGFFARPPEMRETIMGNKDMRKEKKKPKQPKEKPKASGSGSSSGMRPAK